MILHCFSSMVNLRVVDPRLLVFFAISQDSPLHINPKQLLVKATFQIASLLLTSFLRVHPWEDQTVAAGACSRFEGVLVLCRCPKSDKNQQGLKIKIKQSSNSIILLQFFWPNDNYYSIVTTIPSFSIKDKPKSERSGRVSIHSNNDRQQFAMFCEELFSQKLEDGNQCLVQLHSYQQISCVLH